MTDAPCCSKCSLFLFPTSPNKRFLEHTSYHVTGAADVTAEITAALREPLIQHYHRDAPLPVLTSPSVQPYQLEKTGGQRAVTSSDFITLYGGCWRASVSDWTASDR